MQFSFPQCQGAIWKFLEQGFQNSSYFLKYVVLKIAKLSCNVSPYRWDTLYMGLLFWNIVYTKPILVFCSFIFFWSLNEFNKPLSVGISTLAVSIGLDPLKLATTKGQKKSKSRLASRRFSQKTNGRIWFVCREE